jgi:hypothetical protein
VRSTLEDGLRALERASELAKSIHPTVDNQYLEWILEIEARPENQSGADKTGEWHAQEAYLDLFRHAYEMPRNR